MKKIGIAVLSALVVAAAAFPQQALYDVVIHDGMIVDGTGNPWYRADIVVFDPKTVKDVATFEKPKQYPAGIEDVLVNGIVVVENGNHTGAKPGKAILGPGFRQ